MMLGVAAHVGRRPAPAERVQAAALAEQLERAVRGGEPEPRMDPARPFVNLGGGEGALGGTDCGQDSAPLGRQPGSLRKRIHTEILLRMILSLK